MPSKPVKFVRTLLSLIDRYDDNAPCTPDSPDILVRAGFCSRAINPVIDVMPDNPFKLGRTGLPKINKAGSLVRDEIPVKLVSALLVIITKLPPNDISPDKPDKFVSVGLLLIFNEPAIEITTESPLRLVILLPLIMTSPII